MKRLISIGKLREFRGILHQDTDDLRRRIVICAGTACQASGSSDIIRVAKKHILQNNLINQVSLKITGCHGFCEMGPFVLTEPQRAFYPQVKLGDIPRIVEAVARDEYVEDLLFRDPHNGQVYHVLDEIPFFKHQQRSILAPNQRIDPIRIYDYLAEDGYLALEKVLEANDPRWALEEVMRSRLRGRGGAGFPTGLKWELLTQQPSNRGKYLVCNADEGDPGAYMDRSILEGNPHSIIEGMTIGAFCTGATQGVIYVRAEYPLAIKHLTIALRQARDVGLLGDAILGTEFCFDIELVRGAGAFVCGEETALIRSIEGRVGEPRQRPPFPVQRGIYGRPTAINNVETWANIPLVFRLGSEAFANIGTSASAGTKVFSLVGKIKNTGLVEVPLGTSVGKVVFDIGGGAVGEARIKAVQTGGPSGGCIPVSKFNLPIDYESLATAGSIMGSGGMIVMDENTCMVDVAKYYMAFLKDESCGQCFSCRKGIQRMYELLEDITQGRGTLKHLSLLEELALAVKDASMCGLGQTAPNPVLSTLRYFFQEYETHILEKRCPAAVCTALFKSPCQHACPLEMDIPGYIALLGAGCVDEAYQLLLRTNPFPSVCGRVCGHECQTKCRRAQLDAPVAIMHLKRVITDHANKPEVHPLPVTRTQQVAVIGAGPSGLTAALELRKRGYSVTVFEALPEPGGMLRYGIPAYRLPRAVLAEEIQRILGTGVQLRANTRVGIDVAFEQLLKGFDAIYVAVGAHRSLRLGIPGEEADQVHGAVEWLRTFNSEGSAPVGRRVAVIGGGNSAVDAARSALRLGAESVTIYYRRTRSEMPAQRHEIAAAEEEGVRIVELVAPTRVVVRQGAVAGLELVRMTLGDFDASGRRRPVPVEGAEFTEEIDFLLSAISQAAELEPLTPECGVVTTNARVAVDRRFRTTNSKVWAGGDAVTGPGMVVDAIRAGRDAGRDIDRVLRETMGDEPWQAPARPDLEIPRAIDEEGAERPPAVLPMEDPAERRTDFREVELGYSLEVAVAEAGRCMRCDLSVSGVDAASRGSDSDESTAAEDLPRMGELR